MTRATLQQRLWGFSKRDRAKLKRSEKEAVAIAVAAAEKQALPWMAVDPGAHPVVYQGRITWYVVGQKHPTTRPPPNALYVDDETGEVVGVQRYLR